MDQRTNVTIAGKHRRPDTLSRRKWGARISETERTTFQFYQLSRVCSVNTRRLVCPLDKQRALRARASMLDVFRGRTRRRKFVPKEEEAAGETLVQQRAKDGEDAINERRENLQLLPGRLTERRACSGRPSGRTTPGSPKQFLLGVGPHSPGGTATAASSPVTPQDGTGVYPTSRLLERPEEASPAAGRCVIYVREGDQTRRLRAVVFGLVVRAGFLCRCCRCVALPSNSLPSKSSDMYRSDPGRSMAWSVDRAIRCSGAERRTGVNVTHPSKPVGKAARVEDVDTATELFTCTYVQ